MLRFYVILSILDLTRTHTYTHARNTYTYGENAKIDRQADGRTAKELNEAKLRK